MTCFCCFCSASFQTLTTASPIFFGYAPDSLSCDCLPLICFLPFFITTSASFRWGTLHLQAKLSLCIQSIGPARQKGFLTLGFFPGMKWQRQHVALIAVIFAKARTTGWKLQKKFPNGFSKMGQQLRVNARAHRRIPISAIMLPLCTASLHESPPGLSFDLFVAVAAAEPTKCGTHRCNPNKPTLTHWSNHEYCLFEANRCQDIHVHRDLIIQAQSIKAFSSSSIPNWPNTTEDLTAIQCSRLPCRHLQHGLQGVAKHTQANTCLQGYSLRCRRHAEVNAANCTANWAKKS